jgi:DNA transformation protein and related proteins
VVCSGELDPTTDAHLATKQSTIDFLLDQLASLRRVRARKMFGEYALYCDEKVVALICDDRVFVKKTPVGKTLIGPSPEEGRAYPGAKPSFVLGAEFVDDSERLCELIRATADALPVPAPRSPAKRATRAKRS